MSKKPDYRWSDLSEVVRQYVVRDDQGRYGIAHDGSDGAIWAHPINMLPKMGAHSGIPGTETLPANAIIMTDTIWHVQPDGAYRGTWCDYTGIGLIPVADLRHLTIIDDLGYRMPDWVAEQALAGSDQMGHWNYGATLGKVGGEPPVKGQTSNEMTIDQAVDYAREIGEHVTARGLRLTARRGYIPGARKAGRDWLITYDGINHYFDHRPKPGRKPK